MLRAPLVAVAVAAGLAAAAAAPTAAQDPRPVRLGLTIPAAGAPACATRAATGTGIAREIVPAPVRGVLAARLRGPRGADWDLALLDARTGAVLAGSASTGADELAVARVARGARVRVQACRRTGAGTGARVVVRGTRVALATTPAPAVTAPDPRAAGRLPSGRTRYRTLPEIQEEMKALAAAHPDLVRTFALPRRSAEGREILGVEVADGVGAPPDGRPAFVLLGTIHAREWPAGETAVEWVHELVRGVRAGDGRLTAIARATRTFVIPAVNPDGLDATLAAAGLRPDGGRARAVRSDQFAGTGALRRKSCAGGAGPCLARAGRPDRGIDVNRNFGAQWGGPGSGDLPRSPVYAGPAPFAAPEADALRRFLRDLHPVVVISNHTFSGLVIRPPGTPGGVPGADVRLLRALGRELAGATGYRSIRGFDLYPVTGSVDDHVRLALGGLAFSLEIGRRGYHPRFAAGVAREYQRGRGGLREAFALAAEAAASPGTHGVIAGTAPAGRVLRLRGRIRYATAARRRVLRETRTSTLLVPPGGRFAWHVTPTAGPGAPRGRWVLTCEDALGRVLERRRVAVARGGALELALTCAGDPGAALAAAHDAAPGLGGEAG